MQSSIEQRKFQNQTGRKIIVKTLYTMYCMNFPSARDDFSAYVFLYCKMCIAHMSVIFEVSCAPFWTHSCTIQIIICFGAHFRTLTRMRQNWRIIDKITTTTKHVGEFNSCIPPQTLECVSTLWNRWTRVNAMKCVVAYHRVESIHTKRETNWGERNTWKLNLRNSIVYSDREKNYRTQRP